MLGTARNYLYTLPHLRPWQVVGRLVAPIQRRLTRIPDPPAQLQPQWSPKTPFIQHDPWNRATDLKAGRFTFLNTTATLGWLPDWRAEGQSLLWRFNLHYFQYLSVLDQHDQQALCRHWMATFPDPHAVAWHPYTTSLRIRHWCASGLTQPDILQSLYRQAAFLYRNVETYVYGNHLLENARALIIAGTYLAGQGEADQWLRRGLTILRDETPEQILADGLHFERSPMYHALMLEAYLDVLNVLPRAHPDTGYLHDTVCRMGDALATMCWPDGQLFQFNDATQEIAAPSSELFAYLEQLTGYKARAHDALPAAGYYGYRGADTTLMVDAGPVGPSYLMAHAHADIFSYVWSVHGVPFVVDPGVYVYEASPMRAYGRSTKAHSTLTVDNMDQVECWSSFRVARRAAPHAVEHTSTPQGCTVEGTFSGYAQRLGDGIKHTRKLSMHTKDRVLHVMDVVDGSGHHQVASRVHLHPEVTVSREPDGFRLTRKGVPVYLSIGEGTMRTEKGWYSPQFGVRIASTVLVIEATKRLPVTLSYQFGFDV